MPIYNFLGLYDAPLGIEPRLSRIKIWRVANYTMGQ